jgi:hypothetical protein
VWAAYLADTQAMESEEKEMSLRLKIENEGQLLAEEHGKQEITLVYEPEYQLNDSIVLESDEENQYLWVKFDDAMPQALVYMKGKRFVFLIPFGEKKVSYSSRAFSGTKHVLWVRSAHEEEMPSRHNLAFNPYDCHENQALFPHASANVETRGEAVFAARNAIDGVKATHSHGEWPYQSWGINRNPNAELRIDFGREVALKTVVFYLRADFPHDAWWTKAKIDFSDGTQLEVQLQKSGKAQIINFPIKKTNWILLHSLLKAEDPSPFPALTQIEFY